MADNSTARKILISGGGIAGLTAALCLSREGFQVELFEKSDSFEAVGAGIQISPNAMHILADLGLQEALEARGFTPLAVAMTKASSGKVIARFPMGHAMRARYGAPNVVLHRADLQAILVDACRASTRIKLRMACEIESVENDELGVAVRASRGVIATGDALVIAEGVWAANRHLVEGANAPVFSGLEAARALLPLSAMGDDVDRVNTRLWLGTRAHAVHYPVGKGDQLNVVAIMQALHPTAARKWSHPSDASRLHTEFRGWHDDFRQLLDVKGEGSSASPWVNWPLYTVDPSGAWHDKCVVLIGDAAHASLPFAAQGGAAAIEDAAVLGRHMAAHAGEPMAGIEAYVKDRRPRVVRIWNQAWKNRRIYHMGGLMSLPRNLVMRLLPKRRLMARFDWLYGWKIPAHSDD